jgi:ATP-dependent DNA helicase MPH1
MHPYRPQAAMAEVNKRPDGRSLGWTFGVLKKLGSLARAMGYLMESSIGMCHTALRELSDPSHEGDKGNKLSKNPDFIKTMSELNRLKQDAKFPLHPKMVELKNLIVQHFGTRMADPNAELAEGAGQAEGRVMVFAAFREVVEELVEMLNQERPLIRAIKLIGQSTDKQGNAGLNQKGQQAAGPAHWFGTSY